ncbi:MAG: hypothetical protein KIT31_33430, partial [Deltaproteobacteria bacterium]|nr:hypothetical protein [Deltaproteobacteria bacterium]
MREPEQPLGPPPVDPLSDIAWARIERGLWERLDAGEAMPAAPAATSSPWRRRIAWVGVPVAVAAAVAIVVVAATR